MKNPLLSCPYLIKKRQFCQNNTILWAKEVSMTPFFSDLSRKNHRSYVWKNVQSLKNTLLSSLYFVKKTSILSKALGSQVIFFNCFVKNPLVPCPYLVKKNVNSVKPTLYGLWAKKVNRSPFFRFSWKNHCSHAHILSI